MEMTGCSQMKKEAIMEKSVNMTISDLVNGVGTTANGVSSGMSEGNLVGDAPYSTANALSTNMVVTSRVSGSGNTP